MDRDRTPTNVELNQEEIEQSIPERFEKMARLYPRRLAIKAAGRSLTYEALNETANRIAGAILQKRGQGSEPIALLFEHSIDVITALLGTLKAGKFYVALDPSLPRERVVAILNDSQARLIVTNDLNVGIAHELARDTCGLLNITEADEVFACNNLALAVSPDDIAHIMYTSGSTGSPKGTVHTHRALLHNAIVNINKMHISARDRLTLLQPVSFGSSKLGLFTSLLSGASLIAFNVKSEGTHQLARWLNAEQVTILLSSPAVFRQLEHALADTEKPRSLRLIHLTGAPITQSDFELYKKLFAAETLLEIGLGSTEANMICSYTASPDFSFPEDGVPAGYSLPGKKVLLLDDNGNEVGPGEVGEIAVKSCYVAEGYWRQPELTSAKFSSDPNGGNQRIYLTGDLGRKLPDGFLIYLGRQDFQVKIRGYRVETGAIEAALLEHAAIKEAVVVARDDLHQEKRLIAYVVSCLEQAPTTHDLRIFLQEKVPDYMVPSVFMQMDALPLTLNGKVDRQALPEPERIRLGQNETFAAPRNPTEERLAGIWAKLLGLEQIGVHDNFFELGGTSLLAMRLFAEVETEFKKHLPSSTLLGGPTIEGLAHLLSQTNPLAKEVSIVPIQPQGTRLPFFCVHELFGDIFCYRLLSHYLGGDQPFYGLQPRSLDGEEHPSVDIKAMAAQYIDAIRTIQPKGPYALGGYSSGGVVAFEMARQFRANGQEIATVALFDSFAVGQNIDSGIWRFLRNLPADLASWLIGFSHLSNEQRLALIRYRITTIKTRVAAAFRAPDSRYEVLAARAVKEAADLFHFSRKQQEFALAQCRGLGQYRPLVYHGRIMLFRAQAIPLFFSQGPDNGWRRLAGGGVEVRNVPGHHLNMMKEPHVRVLAQELRACLDKSQTTTVREKAWPT